jgi:polar amino acid transport system substrate-binding protein
MRKPALQTLCVLLLPVLLAFFAVPAESASDKLVILTEELPPFNFRAQDGIRGLSTDILRLMIARAGLKDASEDIQLLPWARAYNTALSAPNILLYSLARTQEREDLFKWIGPIAMSRSSLIARKDSRIRLQKLEDAQKYSLGVIRNYPTANVLLAAGYPAERIDTSSDAQSNVLKLQNRRIDLFGYNEIAFQWLVAELGLNKDDFEPVFFLYEVPLYYALSKNTPDSTVETLQNALDALRSSGEVQRVIDEYMK